MNWRLAASVAAAAIAVPAGAETLRVEGVYGARKDAPAELTAIWVDDFSGRDGDRLARAIFGRVAEVAIDDIPWFDVAMRPPISDAKGVALPDAVLRGSAYSEVFEAASGEKEVRKCVEKDGDGKCIRRRTYIYECSRISVTLAADAFLLRADGETVYSRTDTLSDAIRYCEDESVVPSAAKMLSGLVSRFTADVRYDIAPVFRREDIRLLEKRKGLSKEDRREFKQALRLTRNDELAACIIFEDLLLRNAANVTVLYNTGLCHEAGGDLDAAETNYRKALEVESDKDAPEAGMRRIAQRRRAMEQIAVHDSVSQSEPLGAAAEDSPSS